MVDDKWYQIAWKYSSNKGRIMLIFGFVSLLMMFFGVFIILLGVVLMFTIVGVPNPNTDTIFLLFQLGFVVIIIGVISMIIYMIGMKFVPPPIGHEEKRKMGEEKEIIEI